MDNFKIPKLEEFQEALKDLLHDKEAGEGVKPVISFTLYSIKQVDAVVKLMNGWENLAEAIGDKDIIFSVAYEGDFTEVGDYVETNLRATSENVRVANFKPLIKLD